MEFIQPFITTIAKLLILTSAGYIVFKNTLSQEKILKPLLWVFLNVFLPVFFIHSFSSAWESAINTSSSISGWILMLSFFIASALMMAAQGFIGWVAIYKTKLIDTDQPIEMLGLFAISNAGYIPLSILKPIVPPSIVVYMFFFILACNLLTWTIVVPRLKGNKTGNPILACINMPVIGLISGLLIASLNLYQYIPAPIQTCAHIMSNVSLDFILVLLGGTLAGIPRTGIRHYSEFKWHIILKLILFPAGVLVLAILLPLSSLEADIASAIRLALVLEAATPPATTLIVVCGAFGSRKQTDFMGSGIIATYLTTMITIPIFLLIAAYLFY
jgi:predicted permease